MFKKERHHGSSAAAQQHRIGGSKRIRDDVLFSVPMNTVKSHHPPRPEAAAHSEPIEVDCAPAEARASRHIPRRDDMIVASFNLTAGIASGASDSGDSFATSQHSDDTMVAACYCETLAVSLHGKRLGGDVLNFTHANSVSQEPPSFSTKLMRQGMSQRPTQRYIHSNPDRVLDAPQLPSFPSAQLLDWGSNNKIVIGMRSTLYAWDAEKRQAFKVLDIDESLMIRCTQWVNRCSGVAIAVTSGDTAIFDVAAETYVRTISAEAGPVSQLSSEGPLLALGSNQAGLVRVCDLRARQNVVARFEGHDGRIASLKYNAAEPHFLATGGMDGCVRVWDARRADSARHVFSHIHEGNVSALAWNPDRRSAIFSGGDDTMLQWLECNSAPPQSHHHRDAQGGPRTGVVRSVVTGNPITGIGSPPGCDEVATSHSNNGQIQLRVASTFRSVGTFQAHSTNYSISCFTVAPDHEQVCAAQQDETLKFWRVFSKKAPDVAAASARGFHFDDALR